MWIEISQLALAAATIGVLVWTLLFVRRYTEAAEKQQKVLERQAEAQFYPILWAEWIGDSNAEDVWHLAVKNIGTGPAVNTTVVPLEFQSESFKSCDAPLLSPGGDSMDLDAPAFFDKGLPTWGGWYAVVQEKGTFNNEPLRCEMDITFRFESISGRRYRSTFRLHVDPAGGNRLRPPVAFLVSPQVSVPL